MATAITGAAFSEAASSNLFGDLLLRLEVREVTSGLSRGEAEWVVTPWGGLLLTLLGVTSLVPFGG